MPFTAPHPSFQGLTEFQFIEPWAGGRDQGLNVRTKAKNLVALLKDNDCIRELREKAAASRKKCGIWILIFLR